MLQILSVLIIHSTPFDEVAQGPSPPKGATGTFSLPMEETIQVKRFQFSGNQAIFTHQLQSLVSQYKYTMLSDVDLNEIKQRITLFYKSHGYDNAEVTIFKKQKSGTFEIRIVEGKKRISR